MKFCVFLKSFFILTLKSAQYSASRTKIINFIHSLLPLLNWSRKNNNAILRKSSKKGDVKR